MNIITSTNPMNSTLVTPFTQHAGVRVPLIGGPMYPCSNPELVAAVSEAGGLGIIQPVSLTFVHKQEFREGLRLIKSLTSQPIGMNALIEKSSRRYHEKMVEWVDIALEEGVRFFVTSLGNPRWVVDRVNEEKGVVYHDVTEYKWAQKDIDAGVQGLIAVNNSAGGHAGAKTKEVLYEELADFNVPLVCAGGIGDEAAFREAIQLGYTACQLGTRFIASTECTASQAYKDAVIKADKKDIVLSERITGVPVSLIQTSYVERTGLEAGWFARWMLRGKRRKHWMRMIYTLRSAFQLKNAAMQEQESEQKSDSKEFWQAGKSVAGINAVEPVAVIVSRFEKELLNHQ